MVDALKQLKGLEKTLRMVLEQSPSFRDWESVKNTIALIEKSNPAQQNGAIAHHVHAEAQEIPNDYSDDLTWKQKIMLAVNNVGKAYVSEIITELKRLGEKKSDEFLEKRVSTMCSSMKRDGLLKAEFVGNKAKYSIK